MAHPTLKINRPFTYADYITWPDEERWEIIDGVPVSMTPTPLRRHQKILGELHVLFYNAHKQGSLKECEVYLAPFDVRLPERDEADEGVTTVVQPDLVVVCDQQKLDERGCRGAPDLIVEIVSPGSAGRDMKVKRDLYERHGVREYWIVQPEERIVMVYILNNGTYGKGDVYMEGEVVTLHIRPEVRIPLGEVFEGAG